MKPVQQYIRILIIIESSNWREVMLVILQTVIFQSSRQKPNILYIPVFINNKMPRSIDCTKYQRWTTLIIRYMIRLCICHHLSFFLLFFFFNIILNFPLSKWCIFIRLKIPPCPQSLWWRETFQDKWRKTVRREILPKISGVEDHMIELDHNFSFCSI